LCSDGPSEYTCQIWKSLALAIPEIIAIAVMEWGSVPPIRGKGRP